MPPILYFSFSCKLSLLIVTNPLIFISFKLKKGALYININIIENKVAYYIENNGDFKIINNEGVIVEEVVDISDRTLTKISGVDVSNKKLGESISGNNELPKALDEFYTLIENMPEGQSFYEINLNNTNSIICYLGNVEIRIGDRENLLDKINLALNLINQGTIAKGYIDMSVDGVPPVMKVSE